MSSIWLLLAFTFSELIQPYSNLSKYCLSLKVKGKFVSGSGCIDPHFLDFRTSWRWVVSFTPLPLYPRGKRLRYPLNRRLGKPQSRSGRHGVEKIIDPTGIRTPTSSVVQPMASRYTDWAIPSRADVMTCLITYMKIMVFTVVLPKKKAFDFFTMQSLKMWLLNSAMPFCAHKAAEELVNWFSWNLILGTCAKIR
jgi:hypothetical protein